MNAAREIIRLYGREAVSPALLLPTIRTELIDGAAVGFVDVQGARVFAGSPIAPPGIRKPSLESLRTKAKQVIAFGRELEQQDPLPPQAYVVGEQPWWALAQWPDTVRSTRSLRAQLSRATNKGVHVRAVAQGDLSPGSALRDAIEVLHHRWLRTRHMPPLSFVATVAPLFRLDQRRIFVAELDDQLVGYLVASPLGPGRSWLFDHIIRSRTAPNGTAELLVDFAMRALHEQGALAVTLGLCPLAGRVGWPLRTILHLSRGLFDFRGLQAFKTKLRPQYWQRVLVEHPGQTALLATLRTLRAFAGGSLLRFGLGALLRAPPPFLRGVALLLLPWMCALASPSAARFFPRSWLPRVWIPFDLALSLALFWLASRISRRSSKRWLHLLLATLVSVDAVITIAQAVTWNINRLRNLTDAIWVGTACLAPATVAAILWSSLQFREPR